MDPLKKFIIAVALTAVMTGAVLLTFAPLISRTQADSMVNMLEEISQVTLSRRIDTFIQVRNGRYSMVMSLPQVKGTEVNVLTKSPDDPQGWYDIDLTVPGAVNVSATALANDPGAVPQWTFVGEESWSNTGTAKTGVVGIHTVGANLPPLFGVGQEDMKRAFLLDFLELRNTSIQPFVLDDTSTSVKANINGTTISVADRKAFVDKVVNDLVKVNLVNKSILEKEFGSKVTNDFKNYRLYVVTQIASRNVMQDTIAELLYGTSYSSLTDSNGTVAQKQLVIEEVVSGLLSIPQGSTVIAIPNNQRDLRRDGDGRAIFSNKQLLNRVAN